MYHEEQQQIGFIIGHSGHARVTVLKIKRQKHGEKSENSSWVHQVWAHLPVGGPVNARVAGPKPVSNLAQLQCL